jgi:hypothetical protein
VELFILNGARDGLVTSAIHSGAPELASVQACSISHSRVRGQNRTYKEAVTNKWSARTGAGGGGPPARGGTQRNFLRDPVSRLE